EIGGRGKGTWGRGGRGRGRRHGRQAHDPGALLAELSPDDPIDVLGRELEPRAECRQIALLLGVQDTIGEGNGDVRAEVLEPSLDGLKRHRGVLHGNLLSERGREEVLPGTLLELAPGAGRAVTQIDVGAPAAALDELASQPD